MTYWDTKLFHKILPFYNTSLFQIPLLQKPEIKKLSNIKLLQELLFYDELSTVKNSNAFNGYARSYKLKLLIKKILPVRS